MILNFYPYVKDTSVLDILNKFETTSIMMKGSRHKHTGNKAEENENKHENEIEDPDLEDDSKDSKMFKLLKKPLKDIIGLTKAVEGNLNSISEFKASLESI